ncbi:hypothetical protein F4212_01035 [Candidatus Poribacteria bacterium]|nr:hypothetical protein [Candidatus Poribacteria bacterium]
MNQLNVTLIVIILTVSLITGCSGMNNPTINVGQEESGTQLNLDKTYDTVRNGVRLIMSYDAETNSFEGTVGNTTDETLEQVRVEVHLSNGVELGPTPSVDLSPGEKRDVQLSGTTMYYSGWTPHAEVGSCEHQGCGG